MSILRVIKDIIRRQFLSGVLVVVPLIITYIVLRFLFEAVDGILSPVFFKLLGYHIPGLGIAATIMIILLAGFLTHNVLGSTLYRYGDKILAKTPIIRIFYLAAKQLIEAIAVPNIKAFKEVVMIEYPRQGMFAVGFATNQIDFIDDLGGKVKRIGVFIPSTPTPMTGIVVFVAPEEVICLNITAEEGLKLIVSGGILAPPTIGRSKNRIFGEA
jgi:uncharacterized membrane protein